MDVDALVAIFACAIGSALADPCAPLLNLRGALSSKPEAQAKVLESPIFPSLALQASIAVHFSQRARPGNAPQASTDEPSVETGTVKFCPGESEGEIPERYRLAARRIDYRLQRKLELPLSGTTVYRLQFPSPVTSSCPVNDTVHAEYYRPAGEGPFPGVIVLDITGGNQSLSRAIATQLAHNGIAGLFVQMAYYGPRRAPGSTERLLSLDFDHTMAAVRQTVLDIRCATAWMASRPEVDCHRLGILGTSLGSLVAALSAEMEPKLGRVALLLSGGGLVDAYYDDPRAKPYRKLWELLGGTKQRAEHLLAPVDPLTCATNLRRHRVLMIGAERDDIIPRKATEALWKAAGEQKIIWYDCTHYGAVLFFAPAMMHVVEHFSAAN
jgi:dienelactone hydrolase